MYEIINEGKASIRIKKASKISKEMDVFYNPVMKINRDISVLLLDAVDNKNMQIALPLAGSGIRGMRFLKELKKDKIKSLNFNDYSSKAVKSIKNSLKLNKLNNNKKIQISNNDANLFLLNSKGFDYIDVDPFGSSNSYLESAIKRISRNGILAVTNTDTAALTGTYPKACVRKYWSSNKKNYLMHETGLRILIRKVQLVSMQYEKALFPVFSYFKDHYFRIFFRCIKGKKLCDEVALEHSMFNDVGPLWLGNLWDSKLVNSMYGALLKNNNDNELIKFLKIIKEESRINAVGFFDTHGSGSRETMKKAELIKRIKKKGFKASNTHFSGTGIRTDIDYKRIS